MEREEDFHARMSGNAIRRILAFQDHEMESSRVDSRRLETVESSSGWLCNDIRLSNSSYYSLVFSSFVACANIISDGTIYTCSKCWKNLLERVWFGNLEIERKLIMNLVHLYQDIVLSVNRVAYKSVTKKSTLKRYRDFNLERRNRIAK